MQYEQTRGWLNIILALTLYGCGRVHEPHYYQQRDLDACLKYHSIALGGSRDSMAIIATGEAKVVDCVKAMAH